MITLLIFYKVTWFGSPALVFRILAFFVKFGNFGYLLSIFTYSNSQILPNSQYIFSTSSKSPNFLPRYFEKHEGLKSRNLKTPDLVEPKWNETFERRIRTREIARHRSNTYTWKRLINGAVLSYVQVSLCSWFG